MPDIAADRLTNVVAAVFRHAGCDDAEALRVADNLVTANLTGHDSHGVIRTLRYVDWMAMGLIKAGQDIRIAKESPVLAVVDGQMGFGQTVAPLAVDIGIKKAKEMEVSIVTLKNAGHIGRVGAWAEQAAAEGLVSIHFVNARGSELVAPFGGRERRFSTAPFCVGVPQPNGPPHILDFATSIVAEGKVLVAAKGGKGLPEGALIDEDGKHSHHPDALYGSAGPDAPPDGRNGKGAIRAMGEHKGSGLALMCELLGGSLTGNGAAGPGPRDFANGMLSIYLTIDAFMEEDNFFAEDVKGYIDFVKSSTPAAGHTEVLVPGEPERARKAERLANGVPIADIAWDSILQAAEKSGLGRADAIEMAGLA